MMLGEKTLNIDIQLSLTIYMGDIGMADYEKLVKQELPYPISIPFFCNWCITGCYQTKWFHGGYKNIG